MKLKPEQIERLRKPFDAVDAFKGYSEEQVAKVLQEAMDVWLNLARINLRLKQEQHGEREA